MFIWVMIFVIIMVISFLLALRSVRHYRERPSFFKTPYSLYLIQKPQFIDFDFIKSIHKQTAKDKYIVSLERLYKGQRKAWVIYGPSNLLSAYIHQLGLLELEDYTAQAGENFQISEVGPRVNIDFQLEKGIDLSTLTLTDQDQLWIQLVSQPVHENKLNVVMRVLEISPDHSRLAVIHHRLTLALAEVNLAQLPKALSKSKYLELYRSRATSGLLSDQFQKLTLSTDLFFNLIRGL